MYPIAKAYLAVTDADWRAMPSNVRILIENIVAQLTAPTPAPILRVGDEWQPKRSPNAPTVTITSVGVKFVHYKTGNSTLYRTHADFRANFEPAYKWTPTLDATPRHRLLPAVGSRWRLDGSAATTIIVTKVESGNVFHVREEGSPTEFHLPLHAFFQHYKAEPMTVAHYNDTLRLVGTARIEEGAIWAVKDTGNKYKITGVDSDIVTAQSISSDIKTNWAVADFLDCFAPFTPAGTEPKPGTVWRSKGARQDIMGYMHVIRVKTDKVVVWINADGPDHEYKLPLATWHEYHELAPPAAPRPSIAPGDIWRYAEGGEYRVIDNPVSIKGEDGEWRVGVVYQATDGGMRFATTHARWNERFTYVRSK